MRKSVVARFSSVLTILGCSRRWSPRRPARPWQWSSGSSESPQGRGQQDCVVPVCELLTTQSLSGEPISPPRRVRTELSRRTSHPPAALSLRRAVGSGALDACPSRKSHPLGCEAHALTTGQGHAQDLDSGSEVAQPTAWGNEPGPGTEGKAPKVGSGVTRRLPRGERVGLRQAARRM
jgi:hypothetical protein